MQIIVLRLRVHWNFSSRSNLLYSSISSINDSMPIRQQAIIWTNDGTVYCSICVPHSLNELNTCVLRSDNNLAISHCHYHNGWFGYKRSWGVIIDSTAQDVLIWHWIYFIWAFDMMCWVEILEAVVKIYNFNIFGHVMIIYQANLSIWSWPKRGIAYHVIQWFLKPLHQKCTRNTLPVWYSCNYADTWNYQIVCSNEGQKTKSIYI